MKIDRYSSYSSCYDYTYSELRYLTSYNIHIPKGFIAMRQMHRYLLKGMGKADTRSVKERAAEIRKFQRQYYQKAVLHHMDDGREVWKKLGLLYPSPIKAHKVAYAEAMRMGEQFDIRQIYLVVLIPHIGKKEFGRFLTQCLRYSAYRIRTIDSPEHIQRFKPY